MTHTKKTGDQIEVITKDENIKGILMPQSNKDSIVLKLESGYNLGILKKDIKKMKIIKKHKPKKQLTQEKIIFNKSLPTIAILHTGGTIASQVDYKTGAVSSKFSPQDLVKMFPEIKTIANIKSRLVRNMFTEDMNFNHYNLLAKEIQKEVIAKTDGIIITLGTDTIHYTSAALSFMLEDLPIPVLIVGAQRSSDRGSSDAFLNLICAVQFITKSNFGEVGICMHENLNDEFCSILPALKSRKFHTSRRDAFKAINVKPFAKVNKNGKIEYINTDFKKRENKQIKLKLFKDVKVGILKFHPHMKAMELKAYTTFNGLVLEGSGIAGNFPINVIDNYTKENAKVYNELKKLAKKIPVVATSQCIFGRINMNVYSTGRRMQEIGILGHLTDMTTETAFIKLAWLLSNYKKSEIKKYWAVNLRGEISNRTEEDFLE